MFDLRQIPAWMEEASCATADPAAWFPEQGDRAATAKRVCRACPVRQQCLDYALDNHERYGLWGGVTERARRKMIKERAA